MSHPHQNFNVRNPKIGVNQYPPQSAQNQAQHGVSDFADGSGHIFSMYLEMATEEDVKMVESWKADADGILIFTGLFSAAVASLISVSIQGLQQNPQDTSNFYLSNIYQTLADPNGPNTPPSPPPSPPPFSPPNHAVWVNALWFMSLVISLTCALLATLLQQWARRYLKITQSRYSPHKRARIRAFFAEGVAKCLLPWTVDALPTLLHISLFLFFAGLVVFLCNVHLMIFKLVLSWVGLCTALYGSITCMPIFRHDSPYYTPLSLPAWHIVTGIPFLVYRFLRWFNWSVRRRYYAYYRFQYLEESYRKSLVWGMQKTAEETALNLPSEIDTRAFMWTFDCLDEDHELERFFSGLPGFCSSKVVNDPLPGLTEEEESKLFEGLRGLLDRTFSSDLLAAPVKDRRAMICAKAIDQEHMPHAFFLHAILFRYQHSGPVATTIANILRECGNDRADIYHAQFAISEIITTREPFDDSWYILASNFLGLPETSIRDYAAQGDSLSLVILIYVVRQQFTHWHLRKPSWNIYAFSLVLATASNFDVKDTSSKLQHKFCALWNQIVNEAQDGNDRAMAFDILRPIRNVYLALHQNTNSAPTQFSASTHGDSLILLQPSLYPVCKVPGHHSDSTPHIHDDDTSRIIARTISHDSNIPAFVPFLTSPDPPSSSKHPPLSVDESLTDALPLNNQISVQGSTQPIGQTTTESRRIPITCTTHRFIDHSSTSSPPKSNASASPPEEVAIGRTELSRAPPDNLNVRFSSSSTPVLDILCTDSHSPILATAAEGEARPAVHTATTDLPPQKPSPPPVTDIAIDGPAERSLGTDHIEYHPPDAIIEGHTAVGHAPSSDVEDTSSPSLTPVLNDFLPIESHSQMLAPAASGPSRSLDPGAAVEGEESVKAALCQEKRKDEPHDDITVTSDVPTGPLPRQSIAIAGVSRTSSRSCLDTGKHPSLPHGQYDIV